MKKLFILPLLIFTLLPHAKAQVLEAKPMKDLLGLIEKTDFTYEERGMIFGFDTIQSCLYTGPGIVIIKNYCYPVKKYPAKGYTIITPEHGMIDLYEEDIGTAVKHDINISDFPAVIAPYLRQPFPSMSMADLNEMIRKLYYMYDPACWSSNYSFSTKAPIAECTVTHESVVGFDDWVQETQLMTNDFTVWDGIIDMLESKLPPLP